MEGDGDSVALALGVASSGFADASVAGAVAACDVLDSPNGGTSASAGIAAPIRENATPNEATKTVARRNPCPQRPSLFKLSSSRR
ncbi:hypothetical protein [Renibacterium salmoninarum]|uniref:hypothetical protein n=1 Tax=Renibacterium salmoninarum TaxID=1646 RepID=UPI0005A012DD|nr:hypothetical protein [Renibacterium salmoninarum]